MLIFLLTNTTFFPNSELYAKRLSEGVPFRDPLGRTPNSEPKLIYWHKSCFLN